ncbi:transcription termination factor 2-like isoform X1 [Rhopalosiphum padi]|uniref:transcription termination factor 2-like isoform X1 n=1 Tax=Rhopalosiphum padi TaxID=40932 RepID=UPI00298E5231|nr:transcription termination factor 2-like isoform X1 [Rhopalosiphum padi]XP_060835047.1 transcription termination factor 2-like isoform X1 [Rhopalosiphum padi]
MQLPNRRKLFQNRHNRREEIEAQLRRAQIEEQYSTEDSSTEDESSEGESEDEVVHDESMGSVLEEVINEDESEEEFDESEEEDDESEKEESELEEDEDEDELVEEEVDEEECNLSLSKNSLTNGCGSHNKSNMSLNTIEVTVDDSEISDIYDKSINETLYDNTPIAINNNELMNENNSDDFENSQSLCDPNVNDRKNQVIEWMVTRESQKPYGGIITADMGTTDCKITILLKLIAKSNVPNSDNTQSEGESDLDEPIFARGCTLILCPRSSIDDWIDSIERHVKPGTYNVWVHYGKNRDISIFDLTQKDIVITTTTLVLTGFRNKENSPLYKIKWHRIILDDIKLYNYKQQTSKALCQLTSICHWVFSTKTNINNNDDEAIYSLMKFLNFKPLNSFENWEKWMKTNQFVSIYEKLKNLYYNNKIV